ncbi:hypothetical protein FOZ62_002668 [Perkinsus olseni]|uniref:Uncharacterized protein n=1 Tax=Perkinsus olseni TaxID=32597 RepID=A0A7J6TA19_PEROL|nr:hypothetical protein FOZ62_002668 [Perkinsus olseni]
MQHIDGPKPNRARPLGSVIQDLEAAFQTINYYGLADRSKDVSSSDEELLRDHLLGADSMMASTEAVLVESTDAATMYFQALEAIADLVEDWSVVFNSQLLRHSRYGHGYYGKQEWAAPPARRAKALLLWGESSATDEELRDCLLDGGWKVVEHAVLDLRRGAGAERQESLLSYISLARRLKDDLLTQTMMNLLAPGPPRFPPGHRAAWQALRIASPLSQCWWPPPGAP